EIEVTGQQLFRQFVRVTLINLWSEPGMSSTNRRQHRGDLVTGDRRSMTDAQSFGLAAADAASALDRRADQAVQDASILDESLSGRQHGQRIATLQQVNADLAFQCTDRGRQRLLGQV